MNTEENKKAAKLQISLQKLAINSGKWQTCLNCDHWQDPSNKLKGVQKDLGCSFFKALPPPNIIVSGCEEHISDDIPF